MKKILFILTMLCCIHLNATNEIIKTTFVSKIVGTTPPLAPPAVGLYSYLIANDQFVLLVQQSFLQKCKDVLTNISATTTNPGELRQIAFAKAILSKDIKTARYAVTWVCNSNVFSDLQDINAALGSMRDAFDNDFINISQGQP